MNIAIANRLYEYRKKSGLSQEELAEKLGVSRQAVSKWERSEASPDTDNLINLAKLYGVSLDELINQDPTSGSSDNSVDGTTDDEKAEFVDAEICDDDGDCDNKEKNVHIGFDGIHIKDGEAEVHISKGGIHVKDGKEQVHVDKNGSVLINEDGVHNLDYKKEMKKSFLRHAPVSIIITVAFFVLGAVWNLWHPGWIIFLAIPVINSLFTAIENRNPHNFAYPVFVAAIYLLLGCVWGLWHPWWILFITIPLYYSIVNWIRKAKK